MGSSWTSLTVCVKIVWPWVMNATAAHVTATEFPSGEVSLLNDIMISIRSPTDSLTLVERTEIRLLTASHVYRTGRYKKTIFKSMQEQNSDFISIEENLLD